MKAISIKQPWASLIAHGIKDIENRTWKCPEKYIGTRVLIHASAKWDDRHRDMSSLFTPKQWESMNPKLQRIMVGGTLPTSTIIGSVDIVACKQNHRSIWAEPCTYNWVLANPILFESPIENVKGKLSFWDYEL